jgi:hypothetical protein
MCQRATRTDRISRVTIPPINQEGCYCLRECTGEIEEMFKESEDKYTRIHGREIRRWLRGEIIHQRGQG